MLEYLIAWALNAHHINEHRRLYDIPIMIGAWGAFIIGPFGFFESVRLASPFRVPAFVNVIRAFFVASWALGILGTLLDMASI